MTTRNFIRELKQWHPHLKTPFIVSAPMRVFAGPKLAVAVTRAGGLGFIGPGAQPKDLEPKLAEVRKLLNETPLQTVNGPNSASIADHLPIGVGFQLFDGDLEVAAAAIRAYRPAAAWLFVPAAGKGQQDLDRWASRIRQESDATKIWIQVGSVTDAVAAATSKHRPDVLVMQGTDAGGHGLKKGAGVLSLIPETSDALRKAGASIPLVGAGGIADGRGVAAVLATNESVGAVMGTRFLASEEAEIKTDYQNDVLRVVDGGQNTVRTTLFDKLTGRDDWPEEYDGRAIINASVRDDEAGLDLATNKKRFQEAMQSGKPGWGADGRLTPYVGSSVGLIDRVVSAKDIVENAQNLARSALREAASGLSDD